MEALSIFSVLGIYIGIRLLLGHHKTPSMKDREKYQAGIDLILAMQFSEAREYFTQVIQNRPNSGIAWAFRAEANYHLENYYQCLVDCEKALAIDYTLRDCYFFKGLSLYHLEEYPEALTEFEKAVWHFREKHPETFRYRGLCHYELENFSQAKYDFKRAQKLGDEEANFYLLQVKKHLDVL